MIEGEFEEGPVVDDRLSLRDYLSGEVWGEREYSVDRSEFANSSVIYDSEDSNCFYREVCVVDSYFSQINATN